MYQKKLNLQSDKNEKYLYLIVALFLTCLLKIKMMNDNVGRGASEKGRGQQRHFRFFFIDV